jgi:antitoxin (DNA-binding transcriptional repressor) of toxin-antitoxin stability system
VKVTITKLRQDLFRLIDSAREGEPLEFDYKGTVFRIVPEAKPSKLAKLTRQTVVAPASRAVGVGSLDEASRALLSEMQAEWEKDWSEL